MTECDGTVEADPGGGVGWRGNHKGEAILRAQRINELMSKTVLTDGERGVTEEGM